MEFLRTVLCGFPSNSETYFQKQRHAKFILSMVKPENIRCAELVQPSGSILSNMDECKTQQRHPGPERRLEVFEYLMTQVVAPEENNCGASVCDGAEFHFSHEFKLN